MPANRVNFSLPKSFPQSDYTPFGYLDNPSHSAVLNPSGILRSVPPLGMGFWARIFPGSYGLDYERKLSYLSFLRLSFGVDGIPFHTSSDYAQHGVQLVSRYHSKLLLSYEWSFRGLQFSAKYTLLNENALLCLLSVENTSPSPHDCSVHAIHDYGYPGHSYWGCDGVRAVFRAPEDAGVAKFWAYGDVFVSGADRASSAYKASACEAELEGWVRANDLHSNAGGMAQFYGLFSNGFSVEKPAEGLEPELKDHVSSMLSYSLAVAPGGTESILFCLARGVNELAALETYRQSLRGAESQVNQLLEMDEFFYQKAPLLEGDWPQAWKHGWVYDFETIRMTIRPPVGIFQHPWDGMQIHSPRSVLGEASLDALCLSYADMELAKEVLYGTFADAPMPNVPCTREDGSMNMISENGSECGTGPNWGFPFFVIQSMFLRDPDRDWLRKIFPYLESFLGWWMENRTDGEGWFHADCSWESGQDGSKRFLVSGDTPGASTTNVRTVDIEASVVQAMQWMGTSAGLLNLPERASFWGQLASERLQRLRSMYVEGWFRDFDARTGQPILLEDYFDIMMLSPVMLGLATPEQIAGIKDKFQYFRDHPEHWLEWPSFLFPFSEAAWQSDLHLLGAEVVAETAARVYARSDAREVRFTDESFPARYPAQYQFRIPGVANEYWPLHVQHGYPGFGENYGWGATLPSLIIRNLIGFREDPSPAATGFILAPALPSVFLNPQASYACQPLHFRGGTARVGYTVVNPDTLQVSLRLSLDTAAVVQVLDPAGQVVGASSPAAHACEVQYSASNGQTYRVVLAV